MKSLLSDTIEHSPVLVGRDHIISSIFETLLRIEKPNVILTGEPGVGKTAIVEYIKYLIEQESVPKGLLGYKVSFLNLNDLLAGPGYRGSFEQRCKDVFREYLGTSTILFIDEFHAAENMGSMSEGQAPGFGNFLKPIITKSDIRIIGATTNKEYEEMTDAALKRRFRRINVPEPSEQETKRIINSRLDWFNREQLKIEGRPTLIDEIYTLSSKLTGFNPDKAVDITDIMFAKARLNGDQRLDAATWQEYLGQIFQLKKELEKYEM